MNQNAYKNAKCIVAIILLVPCLSRLGFSQYRTFVYGPSGHNYLDLTPDWKAATLEGGQTKIPFTVKNNYTEDIWVAQTWNMLDGLMTLSDSGQRVFIDNMKGGSFASGGPTPHRIVLKPGESTKYSAVNPMELLSSFSNRKVFGVIAGHIVRTNETFYSYSNPFLIPLELRSPPWVDLGEQTYLSVTADLLNSLLCGKNIPEMTVLGKRDYAERINGRWGERLQISVKVANATSQEYIAATNSVHIYIVRDSSARSGPSPWESLQGSVQVVKPSQSVDCVGHISLKQLQSDGYKPGDKLVAAVGGRVPNTNQIFECYSEPFELPPLPPSHPPKK